LVEASDADRTRGGEILQGLGVNRADGVVLIAPGAGALDKCWFIDNFLSVAAAVEAEGGIAVFVLGPAELERFESAVLQKIEDTGPCVKDLPLVEVLRVLSCASGFVGNDSGLSHLAAAMGIRTAAVFGSAGMVVIPGAA